MRGWLVTRDHRFIPSLSSNPNPPEPRALPSFPFFDKLMPPARRILQSSSALLPAADPSEQLPPDSDLAVILAALLCALICVVGLALVARCAWLRRSAAQSPPAPLSKGLKKKAIRALPKVPYRAATAGGSLAECPICLADFAEGDEIRILPQCGHGFHVGCVDTWLAAHSNCPSCRRVLIVAAAPAASQPSLCHRCGACSSETDSAAAAAEEVAKAREDGDANRV